MIGRFAGTGAMADVSRKNLATVVAAAALLVAAAVAKYLVHAPEAVVIGLSLGSLCLTGFPIIWGAVRGLLRLTTNVDELVSIAIVASMFLGEWISAAVVAWIMVLGGLIEQYTSQRARRHLERLIASSPDYALLLADDGQVTQVPVDQLRPGQRILVRPGDVIAADGLVEEGESTVDESMLTGESIPVDRVAGDRVSAGTINGEGSLKIRVERVGRESTQGKIVQLVQQAEQHRAPILRAAEAYAKWFTPTVLALAAGVWAITGDPHRAVTILIVGCPCAFVLATPTAVIAALGRASKQGVLVKGGKFLEACAKVDVLAFDKTGTLTTGRCRIRDVIALNGMTPEQVLAHAARLEAVRSTRWPGPLRTMLAPGDWTFRLRQASGAKPAWGFRKSPSGLGILAVSGSSSGRTSRSRPKPMQRPKPSTKTDTRSCSFPKATACEDCSPWTTNFAARRPTRWRTFARPATTTSTCLRATQRQSPIEWERTSAFRRIASLPSCCRSRSMSTLRCWTEAAGASATWATERTTGRLGKGGGRSQHRVAREHGGVGNRRRRAHAGRPDCAAVSAAAGQSHYPHDQSESSPVRPVVQRRDAGPVRLRRFDADHGRNRA